MAGLSLGAASLLLLSGLAGYGRSEPVARRLGLAGAFSGLLAGSSTPTWWLGVVGLMVVGLASRPRATTRSLVFTQWLLAAGWLGAAGQPVLGGAVGWLLMYRFAPSRALALTGLLSTGLLGLGPALGEPWMVALGFAARLGLMPLHSWLLSGFEKGPNSVPAGFFASGLAVIELSGWPALALPGLVTMLAGAVMATAQNRLRRAVGCVLLSQTGLLTLAWIWTPGAVGSLVILVALGTVTWALCAELVEVRYGEDPRLDRLGASFESMPRLSTAFLFSGLVATGLPGTLGYVAEDLTTQPLFHQHPGAGLAVLAAGALNALALGRAVFHLFSGPLPRGPRCDLLPRETALMTLAFCLLSVLGFFPWLAR